MVLPELVFRDQLTFHENIKRVVDGCAADIVPGISHLQIKFFGIKVIVAGIDDFQDGKAFRCFALFVFFQIVRKQLFRLIK